MGYKSSYAEPDVCTLPAVNLYVFGKYEYILWYFDGFLCISANPGKFISSIQEDFNIKDENISQPDMYLGATISKMLLEGGNMCWKMSAEQYVKSSVRNV